MDAFVFPGQGSQVKGMGQGLFDEVEEFKRVEREVDALMGFSIRNRCLEDPGNRLRETQFTQPCLYTVNALHYFKAVKQGLRPGYLAGHSLGEFNALLAAGVYDFLTGLRIVKRRAELMGAARSGGMAAVVGLGDSQIRNVLQKESCSSIDFANLNTPAQIVISGPTSDIERLQKPITQAGASMYLPLQVSAAFHSRYMADAAAGFETFLEQFPFAAPRIPVISNVTGEPYPSEGGAAIRKLLVSQITNPVQWVRSVRLMRTRGVTQFRELGSGTVLTRLISQIN
jgi:malonyl CoA-acyl carrier protein transacylase